MTIYIILIASFCNAIQTYLDKYLVNLGIKKKDYFYYICLLTIPFSLISSIIEIFTNSFKFSFKIIPFILLIIGMFLRYSKQISIVGCLTYLKPYEDQAYLSLNLLIAFLIDIILGIEKFSLLSIISILITITGVFLIANSKLKIKSLKKDIIIRIITTLLMNYITHFILKYWSNSCFMLLLNLLLSLIFFKDYKLSSYKENKKIIKYVFLEQIFGFSYLYLNNYLSFKSVTISSFIRPSSIIIVLLISLIKDKKSKPSLKEILGIILVALGVFLICK